MVWTQRSGRPPTKVRPQLGGQMSDIDDGGAFSPYLWYKLGQSSAEDGRLADEVADLVKRGFRPPAHVVQLDNALVEIHRLSSELDKANENILKWIAHSDRQKAGLEQRDRQIVDLRSKLATLQAECDITKRLWGDAAAEATEYGLELKDKDLEIQDLRRELQELREGKK